MHTTNRIRELVKTDNKTMLFNEHEHLVKIRVGKLPAPWLIDNLKLILMEQDKVLSKFKCNRSPENWRHSKAYQNYDLASIRRKKAAFLSSYLVCIMKKLKNVFGKAYTIRMFILF